MATKIQQQLIISGVGGQGVLFVTRLLAEAAIKKGLPVFTSETRIVRKSEPYGIPPLVASKSLPIELKTKIRHELFDMHIDPKGRHILSELMIDRFVNPRDDWYDSIRKINMNLAALGKESNAATQP